MGRRLLIIDDDAGVQQMLKTVLEYEQFEVLTARDGLEALACLERVQPDLILLDLMMPNMDGWSLVQELEQRGLRSAIPVIILTADMYARPSIESMQVEGWLVKPFHLSELLSQIRSLMSDSY